MRILKACLLFFLLMSTIEAHSQTELFISLAAGMPFKLADNRDPPIFLNYNIGVEQYIINKFGISLSFRKPFYIANNQAKKEIDDFYGYNYDYTEEYVSYAIDFESKFFFDGANDDGMYISSGISYQHYDVTMRITSVEQYSFVFPTSDPPLFYPGLFTSEMNIYPFSIKLGGRASGDVLVFDYFFGLSLNLGADGVRRLNDQVFDYYTLKMVSFPMGITLGIKF